jgi:hypothetical protein
MYSAAIENEETLHQPIFMPLTLPVSVLGPLKGCGTPRSDAAMKALIQVKSILSVCYEFSFDKQQELNRD